MAKLLAERAKYENWLRDLDAGGSAKPAHVVEKVRADYAARLADVMDRLKQNHHVLTQLAANLTAQLQKLEEAEKQVADNQAESEIRKQVGELSEADWSAASTRAVEQIAKSKANQQVIAVDINRIRELLGDGETAGAAPQPSVVDELAFLKSVVGTATPRGQEPAPAAPFAANVPESDPIVLKAKGIAAHKKSLKCAECGAMNNPSEWYCERCGAELTSI